jgi:integrase
MPADDVLAALDTRGLYTPAANLGLWEQVPVELRLTRFAADTVPLAYRDAFGHRPGDRRVLDLAGLPEPMRRELAWCVFRIVEQGGVVCLGDLAGLVRRLREVLDDLGAAGPCSLVAASPREWHQHMARSVHRRTGVLPAAASARNVRETLHRCYRLLWAGYDARPWWQREVWDPGLDRRIPLRAHEPLGRKAIYFHRVGQDWLRRGLQWHAKVCLETGALSWSTTIQRVSALVVFDAFLTGRGIRSPWLADGPGEVRALLLDYLGHVRAMRVTGNGPTRGQPMSASRVTTLLTGVEQFYAFMHEHRDTAAAALAEPGWARLGTEHARFFRHGEKPRGPARADDRDVIDDEAFGQIMANVHVLGAPAAEGGLGDEQAMRVLMLLARTGRRLSEILMIDRDPLLPLDGLGKPGDGDPDAFCARLRYQQTKIAGAPDTILVDSEVVAIVRAQQAWADQTMAEPQHQPRYLFLGLRMNRHGERPYPMSRLHTMLGKLVRQLDIRDGAGRPVDFQRTHRFRHTRATSLLNAGVPIHVVQRHLGHLSPKMTMHYAQTLQITQEREFLRYKKITADARELDIDPRDLYDMLELDKRADRVLPNGWCLLPPRQTCTKGNACLTCDKFATDASHLAEHEQQLRRLDGLIAERQQAFTARTGQPMGEDNVWLAGRRQEQRALGQILLTLGETRLADGTTRAVRGAGVQARTAQPTEPTAEDHDAKG